MARSQVPPASEAAWTHGHRGAGAQNTQSTSCDPWRSGCNQGTRHDAPLSTTSNWPGPARAARLHATARPLHGAPRQTSSAARSAHLRASRVNRWFWASREGPSPRGTLSPRVRSEEHTSELQSRGHLVCRLLLEKKKKNKTKNIRIN